MKVHSDILSPIQIHQATIAAGMRGVDAEVTVHGSRSRAQSFNVSLTGNSTRWTNSGQSGSGHEHAATWDEWGMFIQALYEIDPKALIGQYGTYETFAKCTFGRFEALTSPYACAEHKWRPAPGEHVTECKWCGARFDYMPIHEITMARRAKKGLPVW